MILDSIDRTGSDHWGTTESPLDIINYLTRIRKGEYDHRATEILAFASSWAYSDVSTFAYAMDQRGIHGARCVSITLANDVLFVDTTAYLLQSADCDLTVLCFRGTEPRNIINWLSDTTGSKEPFLSAGKVHGGFHRTTRAIWPILKPLLCAAFRRENICGALQKIEKERLAPCAGTRLSLLLSGLQSQSSVEPAPCSQEQAQVEPAPCSQAQAHAKHAPCKKTPALYVAGHSLGGALAVLAAALIDWDHDFQTTSPHQPDFLRGIYTYGQPMVGDPTFAKEHDDGIGRILFRHIYKRDIVTHMPPLAMGCFAHLGRAYRSTDAGWELRTNPVQQAISLGLSNLIGVLAWFTQDVLPLHGQRFPFSWGHHSPINYMRTSMIARPGAEFDPAVPVPPCNPRRAGASV